MSGTLHQRRDRVEGAYLGAALGEAMGGPIDGWHAQKIKQVHGRVSELLAYEVARLKPGYALHPEPGSITDDSYIRHDVARFLLDTPENRTVEALADHLLAHANFDYWWQPPIQALWRIETEGVPLAEAGKEHAQGGGIGWWTPVGVAYAGRPGEAAREVRILSAIWKRPLE